MSIFSPNLSGLQRRYAALEAGGGTLINVAAMANGGSIIASSYGSGFPASSMIDGHRATNFTEDGVSYYWGGSGGYSGAIADPAPENPEPVINVFQSVYNLKGIRIYTLANDIQYSAEPDEETAADIYGIRDFKLDFWTGSAWENFASIINNTKALVKIPTDIYTNKIRTNVTKARETYARIVEIEAYAQI